MYDTRISQPETTMSDPGKVAMSCSLLANRQPSRQRASRACDACRRRKMKCNGSTPTCEQCQSVGIMCRYSDIKRIREKKHLKSVTSKMERYEELLHDIASQVEEPIANRIRNTLTVCTLPFLAHASLSGRIWSD